MHTWFFAGGNKIRHFPKHLRALTRATKQVLTSVPVHRVQLNDLLVGVIVFPTPNLALCGSQHAVDTATPRCLHPIQRLLEVPFEPAGSQLKSHL
jgi:hypothetical protein